MNPTFSRVVSCNRTKVVCVSNYTPALASFARRRKTTSRQDILQLNCAIREKSHFLQVYHRRLVMGGRQTGDGSVCMYLSCYLIRISVISCITSFYLPQSSEYIENSNIRVKHTNNPLSTISSSTVRYSNIWLVR